uniref:Uncharacterized protein n=1 Tax=Anguilla anguilla TaxID=7936 RepID=A0A0E9QXL6_ANGAN
MSPHTVSWTSCSRKRVLCQHMLVENLKERTLVALRLVQDAMAGHAIDEAMPKDLIQHCNGARMRYVQYLEDTKEEKRTKLD